MGGVTLKAVPLPEALHNWGHHWRSNVPPEDGHNLAIETDQIDDFLSHDWGTSGVQKYLTLLVFYNAKQALVVSLALSPLVPVLEFYFPSALLPFEFDGDPSRKGPLWVGLLVLYFLLLFYGHHFRAVFR